MCVCSDKKFLIVHILKSLNRLSTAFFYFQLKKNKKKVFPHSNPHNKYIDSGIKKQTLIVV